MEDVEAHLHRGRAEGGRQARHRTARPARAACARSWKEILLDTMFELPASTASRRWWSTARWSRAGPARCSSTPSARRSSARRPDAHAGSGLAGPADSAGGLSRQIPARPSALCSRRDAAGHAALCGLLQRVDVPSEVASWRMKSETPLGGESAPRPAAAGHRRLPAHDRAAVRRAREIGARAGRGDARRQADPAGRPEERRRRTIPAPTTSTTSAPSPPCCSC